MGVIIYSIGYYISRDIMLTASIFIATWAISMCAVWIYVGWMYNNYYKELSK